jgi:protein-disulfide isomerase
MITRKSLTGTTFKKRWAQLWQRSATPATAWFCVVLGAGLISTSAAAQPWGKPDAPVTLMVFSAFNCPYCAEAKKQIDQLKGKYPNDVRIVFKHFPLSDTTEARRPHLVTAAAQAQGKFWDAHDKVFDRSSAATDIELIGAITTSAPQIDASKLRIALADGSAAQLLANDAADAQALKVRATPTFFIDGLRLEGVQDINTFERLIEFKRGSQSQSSSDKASTSAPK